MDVGRHHLAVEDMRQVGEAEACIGELREHD